MRAWFASWLVVLAIKLDPTLPNLFVDSVLEALLKSGNPE